MPVLFPPITCTINFPVKFCSFITSAPFLINPHHSILLICFCHLILTVFSSLNIGEYDPTVYFYTVSQYLEFG